MDTLKYSDSGGTERVRLSENGEDLGPSMEDIVLAMRQHLLNEAESGQVSAGGGREHGRDLRPGQVTQPERFTGPSSDWNTHDSHRHAMITNGQMSELNGVLSAGDITDVDDAVEVDISQDHPRLHSDFYSDLRKKYPRAFKRKTSCASESSSVTGIPPYRPRGEFRRFSESASVTGMPPYRPKPDIATSSRIRAKTCENGAVRSSRGVENGVTKRNGMLQSDGQSLSELPPKPPSCSSTVIQKVDDWARSQAMSLDGDYSQSDLHYPVTLMSPLKHQMSSEPDDHLDSASNLGHTDSTQAVYENLPVQGILKKHKNSLPTETLSRTDSTLSIKERLRRNSETLKALLSDCPFKSKLSLPSPGSVTEIKMNLNHSQPELYSRPSSTVNPSKHTRNNHDTNEYSDSSNDKQSESDQSLHEDTDKRITKNRQSTNSAKNGKPLPHRLAGNNRLSQKQLRSKRFHSPDSQNDSAIETGSVHSSPSSDTYAPVPGTVGQRSLVKSASHGNVPKSLASSTGRSRTPKLGKYRLQSAPESVDDAPIFSSKDSDQDSGIAQSTRRRPRERRDSASSYEMEQEPETIISRSHGGSQSSRSSISAGSKSKPVRGDHTIPTSSPQHHHRTSSDAEVEAWTQQGARPKASISHDLHRRAVSALDLTNRRDTAGGRVRFQDEVCSDGELRSNHRTISQPMLGRMSVPPQSWLSSQIDFESSQLNQSNLDSHVNGSLHMVNSQSEDGLYKLRANRHSQSEQGLNRVGRTSSDFVDNSRSGSELNLSGHHPRSQSATPGDVERYGLAVSDRKLESSLKMHRASPVAVNHNGKSQNRIELAHEFGYSNKLYQDINSAKVKKSKKPWKRNKGAYIPQEELRKVESQLRERSASAMSLICEMTDKSPVSRTENYEDHIGAGVGMRGESAGSRSQRPAAKPPLPPSQHNSQKRTSDRNPVHNSVPALNYNYETVNNMSSVEVEHDDVYEEVGMDYKQNDYQNQPDSDSSSSTSSNKDIPVYAMVNKHRPSPVTVRQRSSSCSNEESLYINEVPPIPDRRYSGNLEKSKALSGSRSSLSEKMGGLRNSARKKFGKLRKAISLDRVDKASLEDGGKMKKSPSLKSFSDRLSFKRGSARGGKYITGDQQHGLPPKAKRVQESPFRKSLRKQSASLTALDGPVETPTNFRPIGKLKQLNPDGTQLIELIKPPRGPFGFYIARGNAKFQHGIFISRLSDSLPESFFAGLLSIGDEILEINGTVVKMMSLDAVYDLMGEQNKLLVRMLPFLARDDM